MTLIVTLPFAGRPRPEWRVPMTDSHDKDLADQARELLASDVETEQEHVSFKTSGEYEEEEERVPCDSSAVCNPHRLSYRYVMLIPLCMVRMGVVYCIDLPAALEHAIISVMRVDVTQYELLNSLYAWPNVLLLIIAGILVDKLFGLRLGLILFAILACLGQLMFAMGGYINHFWLMLVGRFVFGIGGELTAISADIFVAALFRDRELSFVFGLLYGVGRLSSTLNLNLSGRLYDALQFIANHNARLGSVLLFGSGLCFASLVLSLIVAALDYRREKILGKKREKRGQFNLKDIHDFSLSFWLLCSAGSLFYIGIFPFVGIAEVFFEQKYAYLTGTADLANSFIFLVPVFASPILGLMCDWTGYKLFWGMLSILLTLASHLTLAFAGPDYFLPFLSTLCLGLSYSIFTCSVWPQVFLLIREHQLATAYGIINTCSQLGQALSVIVVGVIVDMSGYMLVELVFASVSSLTLLLVFALYTTSGGQKLNMSGRRRRMMTRLKEQEEKVAFEQTKVDPALTECGE